MRTRTLFAVLATLVAAGAAAAHDGGSRHFDAVLGPTAAGPAEGFGDVSFRQPRDSKKIVFLKVRVKHLLPNRSYALWRATDGNPDDDCKGENWLELGKGLVPQPIDTDERGNGKAELWRDLSAAPDGVPLDIHFRVIDKVSGAIVLTSDCNQFTVLP